MTQRSEPVKRGRAWLAVAVMILGTVVANSGLAGAQQAPSGNGPQAFKPVGTSEAAPPQERTPEAAKAAVAPSPRPSDAQINLPTEPLDVYKAKKLAASQGKENAPAKPVERPATAPLPAGEPSPTGPNFKGVDEASGGGCFPPDTHGAVGASHYLEMVNCRVRAFTKSTSALVRDDNLSAFFGDTDFVFDPRALYDNTWKRFVVLASRQADTSTDTQRYYWLGVSTTSNPTGSFNIYKVNFGFNPGDWCDYPQLGMDQDAIIVTCNMFHLTPSGGNNFVSTYAVSIAKARLYNGQGFGVPNFVPGFASIAPPLVAGLPMQQSNKTYLIAADSGADVIHLFRMENTARPSETTLVLQANVPVPAWNLPPLAYNGGGPLLDTLDGRFQNNSVQNGTSLWAVHTERVVQGGIPYNRPRFYEVNTSTNALARNGIFFLDFTSDDWNSSLGVNASQQAFFTFTSSRADLFPQIRTEGCEVPVDGCSGDIGLGKLIQASSAFTGDSGRFGDYTSVSLDPTAVTGCAAEKRAWITNQYTDASDHQWDARIARVGFC